MRGHRFQPETTNGGNVFADCSCHWTGGVYPSRLAARAAHLAHVEGREVPPPIRPIMLVGPRAGGQS